MAPGVEARMTPLKKHQGTEKTSLLKNGAERGAGIVELHSRPQVAAPSIRTRFVDVQLGKLFRSIKGELSI